MDDKQVLKVLEDDLKILVDLHSSNINKNKTREAMESIKLIKETIRMIEELKDEIDNENITTKKEFDFSIKHYMKNDMEKHLDSHKFEDATQRMIYKLAFENGLSYARMIIFN